MSELAGRRVHRGRAWARRILRRRRLLPILAVAGVLVALSVPLAPAPAQAAIRNEYPILAGSGVEVPGSRICTVGAVLQSTSVLSRLTAFRRGVRYLVIAKHCARLPGMGIKFDGEWIGEVSFVSDRADIALVKVDPTVRRRPICSGASQLHRCTIAEDVTPRAIGRVLLPRLNTVEPIPIAGTGAPDEGEVFCTSGVVTGANCAWRLTPAPPDYFPSGESVARSMSSLSVLPGDSGGPVVSPDARLFGIITNRGLDEHHGMMSFVPMTTVFAVIGPGYDLAPAT